MSSGVGALRGERTWPGAGDGWVTHTPLSLFCFPPVAVLPIVGSAHTNSAGSCVFGGIMRGELHTAMEQYVRVTSIVQKA